jgi:hypothetical protein
MLRRGGNEGINLKVEIATAAQTGNAAPAMKLRDTALGTAVT